MDNIHFRLLHGCVFLCANYGWKQRVLLALIAIPLLHPLASASCAILRASTATTVTIPNAATIANTVGIVSVFIIPQEIKM